MPIGSATTPVISPAPTGCFAASCFQIPLGTEAGNNHWSMIGYPYGLRQPFSNSGIHTTSIPCNTPGCTIVDAEAEGIFNNQLWNYDGSSYNLVTGTDSLAPWLGYWGDTLNAADGTTPSLLIPRP